MGPISQVAGQAVFSCSCLSWVSTRWVQLKAAEPQLARVFECDLVFVELVHTVPVRCNRNNHSNRFSAVHFAQKAFQCDALSDFEPWHLLKPPVTSTNHFLVEGCYVYPRDRHR